MLTVINIHRMSESNMCLVTLKNLTDKIVNHANAAIQPGQSNTIWRRRDQIIIPPKNRIIKAVTPSGETREVVDDTISISGISYGRYHR